MGGPQRIVDTDRLRGHIQSTWTGSRGSQETGRARRTAAPHRQAFRELVKLFVPFRRATLLVPSGPAHDPDQKHLFILLTDPVQVLDYKGKHSLLVGVTT